MRFKAEIDVMPLDALLDPQGKAVTNSMSNLGLDTIDGVRIGKHIRLFVEAEDQAKAEQMVKEACEKLLCNKVMEQFSFVVEEVRL